MIRKLALLVILGSSIAHAQSYTTNFPATETPVSEGGNWINGGPAPGTGLSWGNVNTTPHLAYGTTVSGAPPYNDSTAVLSGTWTSNQAACATVFISPSLNRSGNFEVEIRLRTTVTANNINGYEVTYSTQSGGGQYAGFARWNGPLNSFTSIGTLNHSVPALASGDVVCGSMSGSTITEWMIHAGVATVVNTATDSTYTGGSPGMGFWDFGGSQAMNQLYGFSSFIAANTMAQTGSSANVQAALNSISADNISVGIPPGSWIWGNLACAGASPVNYAGTHTFTLVGAAQVVFTGTAGQSNYTFTDDGGTTIVDHVNHTGTGCNDIPDMALSTAVGKTGRLTGVSFVQDASSIQSYNGFALSIAGNDGSYFRVDHSHFNISQNNSLAWATYGTYEGVFDHVIGQGVQGSGFRDHTPCNGDADWTVPGNFGTNTSGWRYYESSIFNNFSNDGVCGGRMAYRFNTQYMTGAGPTPTEPLQTHATSSAGDGRGQRAFEVYGNHFNCPGYLCDTGMEITGGTGLVWGNVEVPASQGSCTTAPCGWHTFMRVAINRSLDDPTWYDYTAPPGGWGYCGTANGSGNGIGSAWDENNPATSGHRCIDAPGNGAGDLLSGNFPNKCNITLNPACNVFTGQWPRQAHEPLYEWMDAWTSSGAGGSAFWGGLNGTVTINNSDVYLDCSPGGPSGCTSFNGTVGVGHGTLAARPATCTAGVAYFATDQGSWNQSGNGFGNGVLYTCTATNTWTLYYTPLCYPHPLTTGGSCGTGGTPAVSLAPTSVAFGNVIVGSTSPSSTIKLTNTGTGLLVFSGPGIILAGTNPTDFTESNNCGPAVAAGGSCSIVVACAPLSAASFSANVSITDNAAGSPQTAALTCTGIAATAGISFSPTSLTFSGQTVGTSSSPSAVTVTNTGSGTLTITAVAVSGGNSTSFSQTNNCTTVAPAGTCTINVTFTPQSAGALASQICVTDNAPASPQCFNISGTGNGVAGISFTPTSLPFGNQTVSSTSAALSTTVKNTGTATLTLSSVTLTGTNAADFTISANTCGGTLTVNSTCVVSVTFTPGATGARAANLTFTDSAPASPQNVALSGTGTQAGTSFSPTSLAFGNQNVSTTSAPLTTTLTNTGSATLNISSITVIGANASDFLISSKTCAATLAASSTCTVSVTFTPAAGGARSANLSFADNAPGSPQTVPLTGTGRTTTISIVPSSLAFPATVVGQPSTAQILTVTNTGGTNLTISNITVAGSDFSQTNNCIGTLVPAQFCTVNVTFRPTTTGTRSSTVVFTDTAPTSPQSVALSGTGTQAGAQVSPASINFANQAVGTTSAPQNVTLTNIGTATLNISSVLLGGTDPSYFAISANTCGTTLGAGANCTVSLTFTPQTAINAAATLSFTDDGPGSPQVVSLSGLGTTISLSFNPASLTFPNTALTVTSAPMTITVSNTGNGAVTITSIAVTGTNASNFAQTNNCGASLAGNSSCTVTVRFTPSANGSRTAAITFTDSAPGSPQTVSLQGTGFTPAPAVTLSVSSIAFGNQTVGTQSNPQVVILTNTGTASLTVNTATMGGSNPGDFGFSTTCSGSLAVNASCTYSLTFAPTAGGSRSATFSVNTNAASSPDNVSLSGTGMTSPPGAPAPQVFGY